MNTKFTTTAFILASGLIASTSFASTLTTAGEGNQIAAASVQAPATTSNVTRQQVIAELRVANMAGNSQLVSDHILKAKPVFVSTRSRSEVRAEAVISAQVQTPNNTL
ncbi:MAG: hypothetical protein ACJA2P_001272 [Rhodoferax sp.]|jgi:hypothetical protein